MNDAAHLPVAQKARIDVGMGNFDSDVTVIGGDGLLDSAPQGFALRLRKLRCEHHTQDSLLAQSIGAHLQKCPVHVLFAMESNSRLVVMRNGPAYTLRRKIQHLEALPPKPPI